MTPVGGRPAEGDALMFSIYREAEGFLVRAWWLDPIARDFKQGGSLKVPSIDVAESVFRQRGYQNIGRTDADPVELVETWLA